jgi:hypothetical protein
MNYSAEQHPRIRALIEQGNHNNLEELLTICVIPYLCGGGEIEEARLLDTIVDVKVALSDIVNLDNTIVESKLELNHIKHPGVRIDANRLLYPITTYSTVRPCNFSTNVEVMWDDSLRKFPTYFAPDIRRGTYHLEQLSYEVLLSAIFGDTSDVVKALTNPQFRATLNVTKFETLGRDVTKKRVTTNHRLLFIATTKELLTKTLEIL